MTKVRRFFYTSPKRASAVAHLCDSKTFTEGALARCGRSLQTGWVYWFKRSRLIPVCKRCVAAS